MTSSVTLDNPPGAAPFEVTAANLDDEGNVAGDVEIVRRFKASDQDTLAVQDGRRILMIKWADGTEPRHIRIESPSQNNNPILVLIHYLKGGLPSSHQPICLLDDGEHQDIDVEPNAFLVVSESRRGATLTPADPDLPPPAIAEPVPPPPEAPIPTIGHERVAEETAPPTEAEPVA
jgi:hypothetical protein